MKNFFTFIFVFSFTQIFATEIDSVQYQKKWYYVYPIEQVGTINYKGFITTTTTKNEIIIPLSNLRDGIYVQFLNTTSQNKYGFESNLNQETIKYKRSFKKTSNNRIPYALFEIKDNKLNGKAFFLNAKGFVVAHGHYMNNLKEGKWDEGNNYIYQTYKNGLLNGLSYEETTYNKRKKKYHIKSKEVWFVDGKMDSIVVLSNYKYDTTLIIYKQQATNYFNYTKYRNGQLTEKGFAEGIGLYLERLDTCQIFNPSSGKLVAELRFEKYAKKIESSYWNFWLSGLRNVENLNSNFTLYGINNLMRFRISDDLNYKPLLHPNYGSCVGVMRGEQYYENGNKMIAYDCYNDLIFDTLYFETGKPAYYMSWDSIKKAYVAHYFSKTTGNNTYAYHEHKRILTKNFNGVNLQGRYSYKSKDTSYTYVNQVMLNDSITSTGDTVITCVEMKNDRIIKLDFLIPNKNEKHELRFNEKVDFDYHVHRTEIYNEDLQKRHVIYQTYVNGFEVITTYDETLNFPEPFNQSEFNFFEFESKIRSAQYGIFFKLLSITNVVTENRFRKTTNKNYHEPFVKISNYSTIYLLNKKPYTGQVSFEFESRKKNKIKVNENRIDFKLSTLLETENHHDKFEHDRTEFKVIPIANILFHNLLHEFPISRTTINSNRIGYIIGRMAHIKGEIKNGQLHGNWICKHKNNIVFSGSFDEGKPINSAKIFDYKSGFENIYLDTKVNYKNGIIADLVLYNNMGDTMKYVCYNEKGQVKTILNYHYRELLNFYKGQKLKDYNNTLTSIDYAQFENGVLKEIGTYDSNRKIITEAQFKIKNDLIADSIITPWCHGYSEDGYFSGTYFEISGKDKLIKTEIDRNVVMRSSYVDADNNLIWEKWYDTSKHKTIIAMPEVFEFSNFIKFPYENMRDEIIFDTLFIGFKNYYANGVIKSEGQYSNRGWRDDKFSTWHYYAPDGHLVFKIDYHVINWASLKDPLRPEYGDLVCFNKNGSINYEGKILSKFEQYVCAEDETYEIYILKITKKIESENVIENPTGYHQNFYPTGVLQSEGELVNGYPHGLWKFYNPNGTLLGMGKLDTAVKEGVWFYGDLSGLNFLEKYCLADNGDLAQLNFTELEKNISIEMIFYKQGRTIKTQKLQGYNSAN